jgi:hypothetical protein
LTSPRGCGTLGAWARPTERGERNVTYQEALLEAEVNDAWSEYETDLLDPRTDDTDEPEEEDDDNDA